MVKCNPNPIDLKGLLDGPPAVISTKEGTSVPSVEARLLVDCRCHLGECVLWDDQQNAVLFTNILDRRFHKLRLAEKGETVLESYGLDKMLCAFGLLQTPITSTEETRGEKTANPGYIVAWEDGFQLYDLENNKPLGSMSIGETVNRNGLPDRLNDGRVDPSGRRFVCGGCAASPEAPLKVYKCEYDSFTKGLKHSVILDRILTTNSICWSLSGEEMYIADSPSKTIRKFEYDVDKGTMQNGEILHSKDFGFPDGSVVDSQGYIWNATWRQGEGTGMVDRIDPNTGDVVFTVHLPDETSEASCCCFGGKNLDILFITTAHENIDPESEPHAGGLYAVKLPSGMTGCQEKRFRNI